MSGLPGFGDMLAEADRANQKRRQDREAAHLPDTWDEGIALHRQQIAAYDKAIRAGDWRLANAISQEADKLAVKLNGGDTGILADKETSAGYVLARRCAAPAGTVPLWGQSGAFQVTVTAQDIPVAIKFDGLFGLGTDGFEARVVDKDRPFISPTGFRSFLSNVPVGREVGVDRYIIGVIEDHVAHELKNRLVMVRPPEQLYDPPPKAPREKRPRKAAPAAERG
jgi:hypothetical protein